MFWIYQQFLLDDYMYSKMVTLMCSENISLGYHIFFSAIRGARKFGVQDISWTGRIKAWLEMMNYDFRIKAENFKIWIGIVYLRILVWLGRVPSLEEIRSVIEKEQKRYEFSNSPKNINNLNIKVKILDGSIKC